MRAVGLLLPALLVVALGACRARVPSAAGIATPAPSKAQEVAPREAIEPANGRITVQVRVLGLPPGVEPTFLQRWETAPGDT
jgi:hypothetical protein